MTKLVDNSCKSRTVEAILYQSDCATFQGLMDKEVFYAMDSLVS